MSVGLTDRQKELRRKYTRRKTAIHGGVPQHTVWIHVDHQSFRMVYEGAKLREAEWMRDMLAMALDRILELEKV